MNSNVLTSPGKVKKWQRARTPEQQEKRRHDILKAAYLLFRDMDFADITLNSIAKESKLSKTSIYLYFKTREEIFMQIFGEVFREWIAHSIVELDKISQKADSRKIAGTWIHILWSNERMCSIAPLLQLTIEHNISEEILAEKLKMKLEESKKLQKTMQRFIPGISVEDTFRLVLYTFNLFSQFIANARNDRLLKVLASEEFSYLHIDLKEWTVSGVAMFIDSFRNKK